MPLTAEEQALYEFARNSLPRAFFAQTRSEEVINAYVKTFEAARAEVEALFVQALITTATAGPPDYLNQHARDRGTFRQNGETDAALRDRLRALDEALTRASILAVANEALATAGLPQTAALVELRVDRSFFTDRAADAGVGGTFTGTPPNMTFTPDTPFERGTEARASASRKARFLSRGQIVFALATSAGNNGTFDITGVSENGVTFSNGSGVPSVDGAVVWANQAKDADGNVIDGRQSAYFNRGYRTGATGLVVILPYGCTPAVEASVLEAVRQKKAAGVLAVVECRQNP